MSDKKFKCADAVWHRVVQIVQEAMLMGVDCVDLFRMIELSETEDGVLSLTDEYSERVEKMHQRWLEAAESLQRTDVNDAN